MFAWLKNIIQETYFKWNFKRAYKELQKNPLMGLDLMSIKLKYSSKFIELRDIINSHDPISLIKMGAPLDEYESEVKTIIVQLDDKKNENEVLDLVYQEFEKWFGDAGKKENYTKLAKAIFDGKNNN